MNSLVRPRSLLDEAAALRNGDRDLSAEVARLCDRIDEVDAELQAFVPEPDRRGRLADEARSVSTEWADPEVRPALYGVPVGVKDVVRVDGLPTRAGSALPPQALAGAQAAVVDRLRAAGALIAGKTATAEFAASAPGPTRNPHQLEHTPGGSSSGSAAAVAAGMVPLAIGTQTIGSMVRPAAYCGVVGFKPTHGRIPADGVIAHSPTFDTVGLFAADVAGVALAAAVVCDGWRPVERFDGRPVLGVPTGRYLERAGGEALRAFRAQVERLQAAGFAVRAVEAFADFDQVVADQRSIGRYEIAQTHADWFPRFGELYRKRTAAAIREGLAVGDAEYQHALRAREQFRDRMAALMADAGVDLWITPAATGPAPRGIDTTGDPIMSLPWSYLGWPAVSVPAGRAGNGLPLGLQCVGRPDDDERTLHWAAAIEPVFSTAG